MTTMIGVVSTIHWKNADPDARERVELAEDDEVRRRADRRRDTADRRRVGDDQHQRRAERSRVTIDRRAASLARAGSTGATSRLMPIGYSIAVVAVFESHIDSPAAIAAKASVMRVAEDPTQGARQDGEATRRSRPVRGHRLGDHEAAEEQEDDRIAERREHLPGGADPDDAPRGTAPSSAVTGIGTASVIHHVRTSARTAKRRSWTGSNPAGGATSSAQKRIGPMNRPALRRRRSKRSSDSESAPRVSARSLNLWRCPTPSSSVAIISLPASTGYCRVTEGAPRTSRAGYLPVGHVTPCFGNLLNLKDIT